MEVQAERPPPYTHNDPETLHLPSVPTQDPPRIVAPAAPSAPNGVHLPDLASLGLPIATPSRNGPSQLDRNGLARYATDIQQWQSSGTLQAASLPRAPVTAPRTAAEMDVGSPMDTESIVSMDEQVNGNPQKATRNQKELLAAEAIVGLGNPGRDTSTLTDGPQLTLLDYVMSPPGRSASLPSPSDQSSSEEREPLLSLVTSRHPWIGSTINGSLSAYSTTKTYSPRFVQSSADFFERNFANTVGTVGRRTGVENSLRRYLGERANEVETGSHKRRRTDNDMGDIEDGLQTPPVRAARTRGDSDISSVREETLPPYDTERSPEYEERTTNAHRQLAFRNGNQNWSTRVMIGTSGLGAAFSERSLRSLKFCLNLLRDATAHIGTAMRALRMVLEDFEKATSANGSNQHNDEKGVGSRQLMRDMEEQQREKESRRLADRINAISKEIWETIGKVCSSVSQYTGGALPREAGNMVRRQLLSVPQRWQVAIATTGNGQEGQNGEPAEASNANRMLAFGKEGLDMIEQVSLIVERTIKSAEQWLDSLGRKRNDSGMSQDEKSADLLLPIAEQPPKR
ncbi:transcription factor opi1 [Diplodia corticola]|uniref:Transcription factor opi1 n=1 Tax=Diplodia corticola TaxID=236234 RepID=A0A1J9QZB6_9PEZI|nr:transcription factor opi1 [Diplodia corticola]OJD33322.1 transcription factor opi1 [Diplodia corticola]